MWNLCFSDIMLKMLNLLKHVFYSRNIVIFEGTAVRKMNETCKTHAQNRCLKSVRKIFVIWSKIGPPKGHLKRSKTYLFRHIFFACYVWHGFEIVLGSNMDGKWAQQGGPKCDQKSWKIDSLTREQFWSDLGSILDRILMIFRSIFDRC